MGESYSHEARKRKNEKARARKSLRERTRAAQLRNKIMDGVPIQLKKTGLDEYMNWRQKQDPEAITLDREASEHLSGPCKWCMNFLEHGFKHCLHCGKYFDKTLLEPLPSPGDPTPP